MWKDKDICFLVRLEAGIFSNSSRKDCKQAKYFLILFKSFMKCLESYIYGYRGCFKGHNI